MTTSTSSRSLKWWQVAAFAFAFTSGGAFGSEACVRSAGAALTLVSIFVTPLIYVLPQILMVCELSGMNPTDAGNVVWTERAWGRAAAAFNSYNALLVNSIDLSLYIVLLGEYVDESFYPEAAFWPLFLLRVTVVFLGFLIAVRSAAIISDASLLLMAVIVLPFLFFFFYALPDIDPRQWSWMPTEEILLTNSSINSSSSSSSGDSTSQYVVERTEKVNWAQFCASSLWLYTGWNSIAIAGDVDEKSEGESAEEKARAEQQQQPQEQEHQKHDEEQKQEQQQEQEQHHQPPPQQEMIERQKQQQQEPDDHDHDEHDEQQQQQQQNRPPESSSTTVTVPAQQPPPPPPRKLRGASVLFTGLVTALIIAVLMYALPLLTVLSVPPEPDANASANATEAGGAEEEPWQDGYLSIAIGRLLRGGGIVVSVAGLVSLFSLFVANLACYSRLMWGMAMRGWLPEFLKHTDAETRSPVVATVAQCIAVLPCLLVSFGYLQRIEFCLGSVSYILTFTSMLRMRYSEPDAPRPFLVPGGMFVAWLITLMIVLVFIVVLITNLSDRSLILGVVCVNVAIALLYLVRKKEFDKAPSPVEDEGFSPQMPPPPSSSASPSAKREQWE